MIELKSTIKKFLILILRFIPVRKNQILFFSYYGAFYGCSPKYISEMLLSKGYKNLNIVWAFTHPEKYDDLGVKTVKYGSFKFLLSFCRSKVICTNFNLTPELKKRKNQIYFLIWHNSLRLKKTHADIKQGLSQEFINMAMKDGRQVDYLCCGSEFMLSIMKNSFWFNGQIIKSGLPRNDILINNSLGSQTYIKEKLGISDSVKIILYAPTFRKDREKFIYNLDIDRFLNFLKETTGHDWLPLLRLHPHLVSSERKNVFNYERYYDVTSYDDVSEILSVADILITDYSSLMFDFSLQKKPVFLFCEDQDQYSKNDFGFYFDIKELPFPAACDNDSLLSEISKFDKKVYRVKLNNFFKKIGSFEDGKASEKTFGMILSHLQYNEKPNLLPKFRKDKRQ